MAWSDAARAAALEARRRHMVVSTKRAVAYMVADVGPGRRLVRSSVGVLGGGNSKKYLTRREMASFLRDQRSVGARGRQALIVANHLGLVTSARRK